MAFDLATASPTTKFDLSTAKPIGGVAEPEKKGFIERVEERRQERIGEVTETFEDYGKGEIGFPQAAVQVLGKAAAGGTLDVMGEGLVSAGRGISAITPDVIEEPVINAAKEAWQWISESGAGELAGEAIKGGVEKWDEFKQEKPNAAKTIESVVNIGALLAPVKGKPNAKPTVIAKTAEKVGKVAGKQIAKKRSEFLKELVLPKRTPTVLKEEVARTTEKGLGVFKKSVVKPTVRESEVISEVFKIRGVSTKNSIQANYNVINAENVRLAKQLETNVAKSRVPVTIAESSRSIDDAIGVVLQESPLIVGNLQTTASRVATKAKQIIAESAETPLGLLNSRKQFDAWVRTLPRGEAKLAADATMEAQGIAIKTVRNAMNDMIDAKVKSTVVKKELKRQSLLYDALANLTPKAAEEANTALGRIWQNSFKVLGIRNKAIQSAAAVMGVGGLGAAAKFAPIFTAAVGTTVAVGGVAKLTLSPTSKIMAGKILKAVDKALLSSKNPSMIRQLRADRALIVELLKNAETTEEQ